MGVFSAKQGPNMDAKRNTFDLSFSNNLTMQFGKIYPVFVKPCDPGDSFNIKASFGLNFLPTVYPVQTPMKAYLHFFYCRNRTVWDDFMNFYTMKDRAGQNLGSSEIIPPYIDFGGQSLKASSLADYMGIPILESFDYALNTFTLFQNTVNSQSNKIFGGGIVYHYDTDTYAPYSVSSSTSTESINIASSDIYLPSFAVQLSKSEKGSLFSGKTFAQITEFLRNNNSHVSTVEGSLLINAAGSGYFTNKGIDQNFLDKLNAQIKDLSVKGYVVFKIPFYAEDGSIIGYVNLYDQEEPFTLFFEFVGGNMKISFKSVSPMSYAAVAVNADKTAFNVGFPIVNISEKTPLLREFWYIFMNGRFDDATKLPMIDLSWTKPSTSANILLNMNWTFLTGSSESTVKSPYYSPLANPDGLRISSLPFRHYEAIYNYFYRDNRNNPLRDAQGNPIYNEVLTYTGGGVDPNTYVFRYHNWEQDFLTTCVQEPQLGVAPLVGISSLGEATFANEDGSTTKVQLTYGEDGNTVTGWKATDGVGAPVAQSLIQMASQGISITDFRNVNAFQTWLEVQMRKTLRFGDSIQGHFNVNPRYDDYLYPEFIGGVTQDVDTYQVNQTVPTESSPLGAYAGQAICKGRIPRAISKFCDEPGYIIGLLSLVPRPVYSQILPKHYLRHETLDYHFPEFNNISYQPVTYKEVCPVLAYNENPKMLDNVFGYQRPWYDLISSIDEAHGQFLTSLNGFILSRRFAGAPQLSSRFLTIHPEDLNDIFATQMTDSNDVILGQLYFDVKKKTTISKFGIPSLQV